jgi:hypothetical protein
MDRTSCGWTASVVPAVRPGSVLVGGHRCQPGVRAPRATGRHHRRRADGGRVGMTRSVNHDRVSVLASGRCLARQGSAPPCRRHQSPPPVATTSCHYKGLLGPRASSGESIRRANSCGRVRPIGRRSASASPAPAPLCWSRSDYLVGGSSQLFDGSSVIFSAHSQHSAALANSFSAKKTLPKCCHKVASGLSADHVRRDHRRRRRRVGGAAGPTVSP